MAETTNGCVEKVTQVTNIQQNGLSKPKQKSVLENLKDSHYRNKVLHSVWIAISLFSLGICVGQMGPSFLDLQIVTNTDVEKASAFFTGSSIGYLTGSILSGALYTRVNRPLLQFFTLVILGITTTLTPYCSVYPLMIFIRSIVGTCAGCVDTTGNAEHMRIWGNDGQVLMQLLHFSFALGGVISPLYSEPFLAEKIEEKNILENITSWRNTSVFTNDINLTSVNSTVDIGISMSAVFPAGFSWTEAELLRVTGPISSCILVSASVGTMINPLMLGVLMTELSNMWFCYLLLGQTVLLCCIFVFLWSFNRFFLNRHYGPLADTSLNIEVSEQIHPLNTIESNDDNPRI
ncbi:sodium-dependent glucose transporter 1A-like isoform X1 [Biomphalaria pfeifferi]|uniref:Sodium-dependent glucose transporter 1A-like isoform X1 n=1 Tax=Biomphalaria pfeifferi TaxID=112525 RepID=A0AAD8F972_BIOPF|nr:sodium-dependent glucose transporter 1A-like isoform X1 [Biomphalaria pfeifferi]